jgi:hypothetical protein
MGRQGRCPPVALTRTGGVEIRMTVAGEVILLADVPRGACPECGSRVFRAGILEHIESAYRAEPVDRRLARRTDRARVSQER